MNKFTSEITSEGFTETLVYNGKTITKRYKKDEHGWEGLDQAWEYETDLPDNVVEAIESRDELEIMDNLYQED